MHCVDAGFFGTHIDMLAIAVSCMTLWHLAYLSNQIHSLRSNSIGDEGAVAISADMSRMTNLRILG